MLSSDDTTQVGQTTEELNIVLIETLDAGSGTEALEALKQPSRPHSETNGRRHTTMQHKQTGSLPYATPTDTPGARVAWRQAVQLREENRRLRQEVDELRVELRSLIHEYTGQQNHYEQEVAIIHSGHQQEIEQYEQHLRNLSEERNHLQKEYQQLEKKYQELSHTFQAAIQEEVRKMVLEGAKTVELTPNVTPQILENVKKTIRLQVLQEEDEHLVEAMYLKREVQQMVDTLDQERKQLEEERQRLLVMQNSVREQAALRLQAQQSRLNIRWRAALTVNTIAMLVVFLVLQYIFLSIGHALSPFIGFALTAPIVVCGLLSLFLAGPLSMIKHIYTSAPHKKKARATA
ncbi:MAG TPA: hypothetical protein VGN34_04980 [Ktedonobacteraceae bacterium]